MKLFTKHNLLFTLYFYVDNLFWYFPLYYVSNDSVLYMVDNSTSLAYICKYSTVNYVTYSPGGECSIYVIVLDTSHRLYSVLLTAYRWTKLSINFIYHWCQMIVPDVYFYFITKNCIVTSELELIYIVLYAHSSIIDLEHVFIDWKVNLKEKV